MPPREARNQQGAKSQVTDTQVGCCCAHAPSGHATAAPPTSVMNSRLLISITSSARSKSASGIRGSLAVNAAIEVAHKGEKAKLKFCARSPRDFEADCDPHSQRILAARDRHR